jgi:hypothetical protein
MGWVVVLLLAVEGVELRVVDTSPPILLPPRCQKVMHFAACSFLSVPLGAGHEKAREASVNEASRASQGERP